MKAQPERLPEVPCSVARAVAVVAIGLGSMLSFGCHADGASVARSGVGAAPACQTCHGAAGEGVAQAGFPRLANLGAPYMQRQLAAFADGTRVSDVMMPIAKALSVAERAEVSAHYAGLPAPATPATTATTATTAAPAAPSAAATAAPSATASAPAAAPVPPSVGTTLATRGRWADKLPACEQCHGPGGRGAGPDFPALAGQSAAYLVNQLTAWQTGARPPGPMGLMGVVAKKLSAAEVRAVADHFAALPARATR